jgi:dihydroneopterin aldolase
MSLNNELHDVESAIVLNDVRLYAFHGVMEQERRVGGWFSVSLRVHFNITCAMETDQVGDTISYADLLDIVKQEMAQPSQLLEHVAGRIGHAIGNRFPQAEGVEVKLLKLNPPMGADCGGAGVEVMFRKS